MGRRLKHGVLPRWMANAMAPITASQQAAKRREPLLYPKLQPTPLTGQHAVRLALLRGSRHALGTNLDHLLPGRQCWCQLAAGAAGLQALNALPASLLLQPASIVPGTSASAPSTCPIMVHMMCPCAHVPMMCPANHSPSGRPRS